MFNISSGKVLSLMLIAAVVLCAKCFLCVYFSRIPAHSKHPIILSLPQVHSSVEGLQRAKWTTGHTRYVQLLSSVVILEIFSTCVFKLCYILVK